MIATIEQQGLTFDERTHTYYFEGKEVPSTTQVIRDNRLSKDWSKVPIMVLAAKRLLGVAVHMATHYHDEGTLEESTLDPQVVPYVEAWRQFLAERRVTIVEMEKRYHHPALGFAGMIDRIITIEHPYASHVQRRAVLDIKVGDPRDAAADIQTAAYAELYRAATGGGYLDRWSVQLHPDRSVPYSITPYRDYRDWRVFRCALEMTLTRAARGQSWRTAA